MPRKTNAEFLTAARLVHGDRYEYPEPYRGAFCKITIICRLHGSFRQTPQSHLRGSGCRECANAIRQGKKRLSSAEVLRRFRKIWGHRWDYHAVHYCDMRHPVIITCKLHGPFTQSPMNHLKGYCGCNECQPHGRPRQKAALDIQRAFHYGVSYVSKQTRHPWRASIVVHGTNTYLGSFATEAEARLHRRFAVAFAAKHDRAPTKGERAQFRSILLNQLKGLSHAP